MQKDKRSLMVKCQNIFCPGTENELQRCSRCLARSYCSRECQKADWRTHKAFCRRVDETERTLAKMLQKTMSHVQKSKGFSDDLITDARISYRNSGRGALVHFMEVDKSEDAVRCLRFQFIENTHPLIQEKQFAEALVATKKYNPQTEAVVILIAQQDGKQVSLVKSFALSAPPHK